MANAHFNDRATLTAGPTRDETLLFWACFISLIATAFGFVIRSQIMESGDWAREFNLDNTQVARILGAGLWPFAISIVVFSLIIDWIGYGKAIAFAFVCHITSAILTVTAKTADTLYWATLIGALGNGTVEAVINPVIATVFSKEKTKWLNRLHAGWPGGLVLGGVLALAMGNMPWRAKIGLLFLPVIAYGIMMLGRKFPINERVAAGVSYKPMLQEVGIVGAAIAVGMIVRELGNTFQWESWIQLTIASVLVLGYGAYVRTIGKPLFLFLLVIMIPLATTELGTDSWIGSLMSPEMAKIGLKGAWVLIYTSAIMLVLRFFAGPIAHRFSPLGLLAISALLAAGGLLFLSAATGLTILAAATLYGVGKTFFWPTMLGVVSEQFPRGGAMTLNTIAGVGMLSVGVLGMPFLGNIQDTKLDKDLAATNPAIYAKVAGSEKTSVFGTYKAVDASKVEGLPAEEKKVVEETTNLARKQALTTVALLPCFMFACYIGLLLYFRSQGGYKPKELVKDYSSEPELIGSGTH